ncbi:MAG: hypothetical protein IKU84_05275 [Clostridia bacterium]|nr:hypothetical protein [Clostridia bacterium]
MTIVICLFFIMTAFIANGILHLQKTSEVNKNITVPEQVTDTKYFLKLYDGKIAVFRDGSNMPVQITDISEHSLCNFDHEQLTLGVTVIGDIELAMRLEDYGS